MDSDKLSCFFNALYFVNRVAVKIETLLMGSLSSILLILMLIQVLCRYLFYIPTPWAEEAARYLFLWIVYVSAAYALFQCDHIEINLIDVILAKTNGNIEKKKQLVARLSLLCTAVFLGWFCYLYSGFLMRIAQGRQHSTAMGISMVIPMSSVIVGGVLMLFHAISLLILPERYHPKIALNQTKEG